MKPHVPKIERANAPDADVAVGAILPLFRALLDGRLKRPAVGEPQRIESLRSEQPQQEGPP